VIIRNLQGSDRIHSLAVRVQLFDWMDGFETGFIRSECRAC
jgi:hypothetical protein